MADSLKAEMCRNGAYELSPDQIKAVTELVIDRPGRKGDEGAINKKYVGKDAAVIAKMIGVEVPSDTKILLCEVDKSHPLVWTEQLMPVIPLVRLDNVDEAIRITSYNVCYTKLLRLPGKEPAGCRAEDLQEPFRHTFPKSG